jgi:hypothetical protein
MRSFSFASVAFVAVLAGGERPPAGWLGPVAPTVQNCFYIGENGEPTPGGWGGVSGQANTPSGRLIYFIGAGGQLVTTGYAGGRVQLFAPGGQGAAKLRLRVTRVSTGQVLYDQTVQESQVDDKSYLLHDVVLPAFAAWRLEIFTVDGSCNLTDIIWT